MLLKHPDQYEGHEAELEAWVRHLVEDKVSEGPLLDYKESVKQEGQWKREAAKDISSFANEKGGTIIYGIPEDKQSDEVAIPKEPYGIDPVPGLEEQLENIYVDSILPRLAESRVKKVELSKYRGKLVYVAWTPESWLGPHMVSAYGEKRYYRRGQLRTVLMEEHEVRLRYERTQRLKSAVFEFLDSQKDLFTLWYDRFAKQPFMSNYVLCPYLFEIDRVQLSSKSTQAWLNANHYQGRAGERWWRPCAEGVETCRPFSSNETPEESIQFGETAIYKSGAITRWGATETWNGAGTEGKLLLDRNSELNDVWTFLEFAAKLFQQVAYYGPLWFRVSIFRRENIDLWIPISSFPKEWAMLQHKGQSPLNWDLQISSADLFNDRRAIVKKIADELYRLFGQWEAPGLDNTQFWNIVFR